MADDPSVEDEGGTFNDKLNAALAAGHMVIIAPKGMTGTEAMTALDSILHDIESDVRVMLFASPNQPEWYGSDSVH